VVEAGHRNGADVVVVQSPKEEPEPFSICPAGIHTGQGLSAKEQEAVMPGAMVYPWAVYSGATPKNMSSRPPMGKAMSWDGDRDPTALQELLSCSCVQAQDWVPAPDRRGRHPVSLALVGNSAKCHCLLRVSP
jgi:hypothetical protein